MWTMNDEIYDPTVEEIKQYEGFVYIITNTVTDKKYIGMKHFWTRQKNRKTGRRETKESNWRDYTGSSVPLNQDIETLGLRLFKKDILHLCAYAKQMTFWEQKEQWERGVLLRDDYYNTNIGGKFFIAEKGIYEATHKKVTTKNDKWREIRSEQMKGDNNIAKREDVRIKISEKKRGDKHHQWGVPLTEEHVAALRKGHQDKVRGVPKSAEHRAHLSDSHKRRGDTWWNNGIQQKMAPTVPGESWVRGRISHAVKYRIKLQEQEEVISSLLDFSSQYNIRVESLRYCLQRCVGSKKHRIEYVVEL